MRRNLGQTMLRRNRRQTDPMREFDQLPPSLRAWVADAALPWGPRSVRRAYQKALARTGDHNAALEELERLQARQLAKDSALAAAR